MTGKSAPTTISTKQARIAMLTKKFTGRPIRGLSTNLDADWLHEAHRRTRKGGAVGVDGQTSEAYAADLEGNLERLLEQIRKKTYRAPVIRRVEIPKASGGTRSLGITTFEDKVAQQAVKMTLEPMYEEIFYDFSYGFRPRRSAHDALEHLKTAIQRRSECWVLQVDVSKFFDTIDREQLKELLEKQVNDRVIIHLVAKWLRAGILEGGVVQHAEQGTPQGGVISPLLANIYLHHVLDAWWVDEVRSRLRGSAELIRYADDFVMVFDTEADAHKVTEVLPKRFARYGLTIHPGKTSLSHMRRPPPGQRKSETFDFLGFTHFFAKAKSGRWWLRKETASKRLSRSLLNVKVWVNRHAHANTKWQLVELNRKLKGYYQYYGVIGNYAKMAAFRDGLTRRWRRALLRRSQKAIIPWHRFAQLARQLARPTTHDRKRQLQLVKL